MNDETSATDKNMFMQEGTEQSDQYKYGNPTSMLKRSSILTTPLLIDNNILP